VHPASLSRSSIGGRNMPLRYEGTCAHLACCSAHAVAVADDTPGSFACAGQGGNG